ncbi:hypothetical protein Q5530_27205 [Saccharothrix sp. BKS2]|uniref:hypothetical protein n=1 Tax=Saccharothrix sp. BKS2 TaxID=3064400 RepID=UPI0039E9B091
MIGKRMLTAIATVGALMVCSIALPGTASAASGGGCTTGNPGGTSVRPCISYSGSASSILVDGYINSLGGNSCLQIDRNWLLNGNLLDDGFSIVYGTGYVVRSSHGVSRVSGQTARAVWRVHNCSGTFLGEVRTPQQNFP